LKGNKGSMISSNVFFKVDRCTNETKESWEEPCASPEEIDEFVYDLEVHTWTV